MLASHAVVVLACACCSCAGLCMLYLCWHVHAVVVLACACRAMLRKATAVAGPVLTRGKGHAPAALKRPASSHIGITVSFHVLFQLSWAEHAQHESKPGPRVQHRPRGYKSATPQASHSTALASIQRLSSALVQTTRQQPAICSTGQPTNAAVSH